MKLGDIVKFNPDNNNIKEYNMYAASNNHCYRINRTYKIVETDEGYDCELYILQDTKTGVTIDNTIAEWELINA